MNIKDRLTNNLLLKLLALLLAAILWLFVTFEKEAETEVAVSVEVKNLSPGLTVVGKPLPVVNARIAGPKIRILRMRQDRMKLQLDFKNVGEGTVAFSGLERSLAIPSGLRVTRIYPATIEVKLVKSR